MLDVFILAMIAGAVIWRLFKTFGQVGSHIDRTISAEYTILDEQAEQALKVQQQYAEEQLTKLESQLSARALEVVRVAERYMKHFNVAHFLEGANKAYEILMTAIANFDTNTIDHLLTSQLQAKYHKAIDDLKRQGYRQQLVFIGINKAEVRDAHLSGDSNKGTASFTVYFESEVVTSIVDSHGNVVEGDAKKVRICKHNLVFEKKLDSAGTMWTITECDL